MSNYEVAVIGGGPGGYVTAIRLNQYGINTVVYEKERLGGVCLNRGCIPTKTLVKSAELLSEMKRAEEFGLICDSPKVNYSKVFERKNKVVNQLVSGIEFLFKKRKIDVIKSAVEKIEKKDEYFKITTDKGEESSAKYVILATGSEPTELPFMKFDGKYILSSRDVLKMDKLPESMIVVGGGVVGCEFASIFNEFGVKTEIVEFLPALAANENPDISKRLAMAFKRNKIKLHLKTAVEACKTEDGKAVLSLSNGKNITADAVLVSTGRKPVCNIEFVNCEPTRENKAIAVDDLLRTNVPGMFAIGDLTGKMQLAHTASKQGLLAAETIKKIMKGEKLPEEKICYENIPRCIFTHPEIGSAGLTEPQAKEKYKDIIVGSFQFTGIGKALATGNTFGFVKVIADKETHKLVGMHIIGPNATELIAEGGILVQTEASAEKALKVVYAHPTLSEAVMESIEDLEGLSIHKV
ncbi:MAG: dihydrolipoyl dehydrogenase [Candidatus Cloacimonadota bacterium]|nr:MAG: dihydrolipoyl dehydrogenase [Candidatus Cloacimonadota bacterium]